MNTTNNNTNTQMNWQHVEEQVNTVEKQILETKQKAKAQVLHRVHGTEEKKMLHAPKKRSGSEQFLATMQWIEQQKQQLHTILQTTDTFEYEAKQLLSKEGQALASLRFKNLAEALRAAHAIDQELAYIKDMKQQVYTLRSKDFRTDPVLLDEYQSLQPKIAHLEQEIIHFEGTGEGKVQLQQQLQEKKQRLHDLHLVLSQDMRDNHALVEQLQQIIRIEQALQEERGRLYEQSPEAFIGLHLKELKAYKKQIEQGGIVVTPYVQAVKEDIVSHLHISKPVFVSGHLGSGKTELAIHIAKELTGKDPLIISGAEDTSLSELYGHQVLRAKELDLSAFDQYNHEVELKFEEWKEANKASLSKIKDEEEKRMKINQAHDRILQLYLTQFQSATTSGFLLGKVYQAMKEGRVLILDEVNAIPHEVLISMNHILTRKPGDSIDIQQYNGEEVAVAQGFAVIATGNLNTASVGKVYIGRKELDLAWRNRFYEKQYDYLPQSTEGSYTEVKADDEQFHLMLTQLMDSKGALRLPEGGVRKLWNLAKAAKSFQDIFSGKRSAEIKDETTGQSQKVQLLQAVPSFRDLLSIVHAWKEGGYTKELDYYIFREFLSRASFPDADKAFLYTTMQTRYDFFNTPGWKEKSTFVYGDEMKHFTVQAPENKDALLHYATPRETVQIAFGKAPERTVFPQIEEDEAAEMSAEVLAYLQEMESEIAYIESVKTKVDDKKAVSASPISSN